VRKGKKRTILLKGGYFNRKRGKKNCAKSEGKEKPEKIPR